MNLQTTARYTKIERKLLLALESNAEKGKTIRDEIWREVGQHTMDTRAFEFRLWHAVQAQEKTTKAAPPLKKAKREAVKV